MTSQQVPTSLGNSSAWLPDSELPSVNRTSTVLGVTITFTILAWIAVCLRLYTRFFFSRTPGWDDLFVFLACLSCTAGSVTVVMETDTGLGQHMMLLSVEQVTQYSKLVYAGNLTYLCSAGLIKTSIMLQYLRIFTRDSRPRVYWTCVALLSVIVMWTISFVFAAIFGCSPIAAHWDPILRNSPSSHCVLFGSTNFEEVFHAYAGYSSSNMFLDFVVFAIPIPFWRDLSDRNKKSRVALWGLFSMGSIVVGLAAMRLGVLVSSKAGTYPDLDFTWHGPPIFIASALEVTIAIICASMPIFWPVIPSFPWGKIHVLNEISVQSNDARHHHLGGHGDIETESARGYSWGNYEDMPQHSRVYQKEIAVGGWGDPLTMEKSDTKRFRPWSTRVEHVETAPDEVELFEAKGSWLK